MEIGLLIILGAIGFLDAYVFFMSEKKQDKLMRKFAKLIGLEDIV